MQTGRETQLNELNIDIYSEYQDRIISLINGADYILFHTEATSDEDIENIKKLRKAVRLFKKNKLAELNHFANKMELNHKEPLPGTFITELYTLTQELGKLTNVSTKDLLLAEAFVKWQSVSNINPTIETPIQKREHFIIQKETLLNSPLTPEQKIEFQKIHSDNKPAWFIALPAWAKHALVAIVPRKNFANPNWNKVEHWRPTILRFLPGQANATLHELIIKNKNGKVVSHTQCVRQGTPSSFNMKDSLERQESANQNIQQMVDAELNRAKNNFKTIWGVNSEDFFEEKKFPVLFGGLLTPKEQGNWISWLLDTFIAKSDENNTLMVQEKNNALAALNKPSIKIFNLNVAINALRKPGFIPQQEKEFIVAAKNFSSKMRNKIEEHQLGDEEKSILHTRKNRVDELNSAITCLESLGNKIIPERNESLYRAALYDVITRLMGGLSTGNCKSSKDRKGIELIMADSMLVYYQTYGTFPKLDDELIKRQNFVKIFCDIYVSGHQIKVAKENCPGASGIKDEGKLIDKDIKFALDYERNNAYLLSKEFSSLNKPGTFWQKQRGKIAKIVIGVGVSLAVILGVGFFLGLNLLTGGLVSLTILGIFGLGYLTKELIEMAKSKKTTFAGQLHNLPEPPPPAYNAGSYQLLHDHSLLTQNDRKLDLNKSAAQEDNNRTIELSIRPLFTPKNKKHNDSKIATQEPKQGMSP